MTMSRSARALAAGAAFASLAAVVPTVAEASSASPSGDQGAPGIGDPYLPLEGNGGYDVRHYDLSFSYDPRPTASTAST
ncbi:MAG TPA: hypothetical protein VEX15_08185 [Nocardioidaceae bacterium]|nr:hypothetical protein [Nocardioidaceae bacterium]